MFALHETTQRRVCRVTFLVLCVVPTLLTLVGIAYCNRPWRENDWQRALRQKLHVRVSLDDISSPRPGLTVLKNVRLGDLRTDRTLGVVNELCFHRKDSRLLLHAEHLAIEAEHLPAFSAALSTWLATDVLVPLDFQADELTITNTSMQTLQLENLVATGDKGDAGTHRYRLQAQQGGEILQILLDNQGGRLHGSLDTRRASLPAWLIGSLVPGFAGCGEARFSGEVIVENENHDLHGELRGEFEGVNLQQWIGVGSRHHIQGVCEVQLQALTWSRAGITKAQGKISSGSGAASYSLYQALASPKLFQCTPGPGWKTLGPTSPEELIFFDQLAVSFQVTSAGILLAGKCPDGALMTAGRGSLLYGPPEGSLLPVANLVQLFHDPRQGWLPDTRGAHEMSKELPLPESQGRESGAARK